MYFSKKVKDNPLRAWYYGLSMCKLADARRDICKYCGISLPKFYRWLSGATPIPVSAQIVINQVAGEHLYEVEEPISIKESA